MTIKPHLVHYAVLAALAVALSGCASTTRVRATVRRPPPPVHRVPPRAPPSTTGQQVQPVANEMVSNAAQIVYFDFDSFVIKPEYQGVIDQQARYLQSHPAAHVALEGNTDERGSREYNLALGQKRAEAVQRALVLEGASGRQIESVSFGAEKPADPGHDETAWAKNRRVEFHYR